MAVFITTFSLGASRRRKLPLANPEQLRTAQITHPAALFDTVRYCSPVKGGGLEQFSPNVIVGSAQHLLALADAKRQGQIELPDLNQAIYVLTDSRDVPIGENGRHLLWQTFEIPVFELLLGPDYNVVASECDAHEGWHIEPGVTFFVVSGQLWFRKSGRPVGTGLTGYIEEEACACGGSGKRIMNAGIDFRDPIRGRLSAIA